MAVTGLYIIQFILVLSVAVLEISVPMAQKRQRSSTKRDVPDDYFSCLHTCAQINDESGAFHSLESGEVFAR